MHVFFRWEGQIFLWWDFPCGGDFPGGILHWGNLPEFLYKILFILLLSLFRLNFTCGVVKGNGLGLICLENIFMGRVFLRGGGAKFPGII